MAGVTLKVSPKELKAKAAEIQSQIKSFEKNWEQLSRIIKNTKGYWMGEAGEAHQQQFERYAEDVERIVKRLGEHPEDLLKMADIYEDSEKQAIRKAQQLSGDVIV